MYYHPGILTKFVNRFLPSYRVQKDPAICITEAGAEDCPYQPIPIHDVKLIPNIRKFFYSNRNEPISVQKPRYDKKLTVIVPYRKREEHLAIFPHKLHDFLTKQGINYQLLIIEQADSKPFNHAKLTNIGAQYAWDSDYFCFHDVDMIPLVSDYAMVNHPVLLANSVSQFDVEKNHSSYFGGVIMLTKVHFEKVNGFSNEYWHWGYEDDDMMMRCLMSGLTPIAFKEGRYESLPHKKSIARDSEGNYQEDQAMIAYLKSLYMKNKKRFKKMRRGLVNFQADGFKQLQYKLIKEESFALYKKLVVEL